MWIEKGKFYRTRDGRKIGPIEPWTHTDDWEWHGTEPGKKYGYLWDANGVNFDGAGSPHDLVAEWTDEGPVRTETVTVRRMEPGVYGRLGVGEIYGANSVWVEIKKDRNGSLGLNAHELRELARVALDVAEYLDGLD